SENIQTVRDLITRTEAQLLAVRNLGKTSLLDIQAKLTKLGLGIGMTIDAASGIPVAEVEAEADAGS
ncbi:hypothetical protein HQ576_03300, partial [bacterium]|nr:hypothetical protein [bacterium]